MRTIQIYFLTLSVFVSVLSLWFHSERNQQMGMHPSIATEFHLDDPDETFNKAVKAYEAANFSEAIELFSAVAQDQDGERVVRRDALHYLGRAYMARRNEEKAKDALSGMVKLEPPRIEFDPDIESPKLMRVYYDVRKDGSGDYEVHQEAGVTTLAVLDFTNNSIDDYDRLNPLQKGFSSLFINQLNGATSLRVIERERIQWLLDELDLQADEGRVDQQTAVRAGKLLGAQAVLLGSYIKHGKKIVITARLVKVETGEIIMSEKVTGKADRFFDLADELSLKVAKGINVDLEQSELGARSDTRSLDAMISYSEGLDLLEKEEYQQAYAKFSEALEYDPDYRRASIKAKSIEPMLYVAGINNN
ncbi:MAG: CsgG/HfaB family protein [Rhodothermales bacterium]